MFETIFKKLIPDCQSRVLEQTIQLAVELAREGREGHKIGTMFVVGDEGAALKQSKPLILDPLKGHRFPSFYNHEQSFVPYRIPKTPYCALFILDIQA